LLVPTLFPYSTLFRSLLGHLVDLGQNAIQLVQAVVLDHQPALTFSIVVYFHHSSQGIGQIGLQTQKVWIGPGGFLALRLFRLDRSEEHTSELQSREKL